MSLYTVLTPEERNNEKFTYWQRNGSGEYYHKSIKSSDPFFHEITLSYYLEFIKKSDKVIDIGAGTGRLSIPLAKYGCSVTSVDISSDMLGVLEKNKGRLKINTLVSNCEDIPLDNSSFDVAVSHWVMTHFYHWELFLREQSRLVKQNGFIIFDFYNGDNIAQGESYATLDERGFYIGKGGFYASATQVELDKVCSDLNLQIVDIIPYDFLSQNANAKKYVTSEEMYDFMSIYSKMMHSPENLKVIKMFERMIVRKLPPELCSKEIIVLRKK